MAFSKEDKILIRNLQHSKVTHCYPFS